MWGRMKSIMKQRNFMILFVSFGIGVGAFYTVSTLLDVIIADAGYTEVSG